MAFENTMDKYGDEATMAMIIERTIDEYCDDSATKIGKNAFYGCTALTEVDVPNVETIEQYAFAGCTTLTKFSASKATSIGGYAFQSCPLTEFDFTNVDDIGGYAFRYGKLTSAVLPKIERLGYEVFYDCTTLSLVDLPIAVQLNNQCFRATNLTTLILRNTTTLAVLPVAASFTDTPMASGTGFIYVPRALVDSYKTATNWSTYAAQFRALEDYTVDGTITGDLDESKI